MAEGRPNILFAIADDASHMSAYGHAFVNTPNFDRVAAMGARFDCAFTTNPKCAPSRASILTGRQTWQLEEACNHFCVFPSTFALYPDLLEEAGYHVGYTGKGWAPGDWQRNGLPRNPAGPVYNDRKLTPPDETMISAIDYAGNFADFQAARPEGAPWYFWYGGFEPHRHYTPGEGRRAGKDLASVVVPPYLPDTEEVRSDLLDYAYEVEWFDAQLGKILDQIEAAGELENTLVVVTSDNGMPFPRVKGNMYEQDFNLPFAACWLARMPGGRTLTDLVSFVDIAPTFLEVAGLPAHEQMSGRSLLRLLASATDGRVDPTRERVFMGRERHDMGREGDVGYPVRCVRTPEYLYVRNFAPERWPAGNPETWFPGCDGGPTKTYILDEYEQGRCVEYFDLCFGKRPAEELYHIGRDRDCMHNLADDPAHAELKAQLWAELEAELRAGGDPRIVGQGDWFDQQEYTGQATHSWANYLAGTWKRQSY